MGVNTTINLTRTEAEEKYVDFRIEQERRKLRAEAVAMESKELEDILEIMNDKASCSGAGFENYQITGEY